MIRELDGMNRSIDVHVNESKSVNSKFPREYKHVGTRMGVNLNSEVASRCGMMQSGCAPLKAKVLHNMSIDIGKRLSILTLYIFTKGVFQCSTWSDLSPFASKKFRSTIMNLYRRFERSRHIVHL